MYSENQDQRIAAHAFDAKDAGAHTMRAGRDVGVSRRIFDGPRIWRSYVFEAKPRIASRVMVSALKGVRRECELEAMLANCTVRDGADTAGAYLSDDQVKIVHTSSERVRWWPLCRRAYNVIVTGTVRGVRGFENRLDDVDILSARDITHADASFSIRPPLYYPSDSRLWYSVGEREILARKTDSWCSAYRQSLLERFPLIERITLVPGHKMVGLMIGGPADEMLRMYEGTLRNCAGGTVISREIRFR